MVTVLTMSVLRAQATIQLISGLPTDVVVNNFHFGTTGDDDLAAAAEVSLAVRNFYTANGPDGQDPIATILSSEVKTGPGNLVVKVYRMNDAIPRVPLLVDAGTVLVPGVQGLPAEVAICASFQGVKLSGQFQGRRRGRVFIGPLEAGTVTVFPDGARPSAAARSIISEAMRGLSAASLAAPAWSWIVYSKLNGLNDTVGVANGWVDNAFDTIRSRGPRPNAREIWTAGRQQ